MMLRSLAMAGLGVLCGLGLPVPGHAYELVSVQGVDLPGNATVTAFSLELSAVLFVAVCHVPTNWMLETSGNVGGPDTVVSGREPNGNDLVAGDAGMFSMVLRRAGLKQLHDFVLVDDTRIDLGKIKGELSTRRDYPHGEYPDTIVLHRRNFALRPADRCPAPC